MTVFHTSLLYKPYQPTWLRLLAVPCSEMHPHSMQAVFGLFGVSVLVKLAAGFNLKKLIEAAILGQYVVLQLSQA